jgi:pimeloyl-ACP methyl ester carboxylesterase
MPASPYTEEQDAEFEAAIARGDLEAAAKIDFAVWAPLGADDELRELWRSTPDALGVPDGTELRRPEPAHDRLDRIDVPTLVVRAAHDPRELREVGAHVARQIPGARLVEVDSDHYLTLREAGRLTQLLEEFLLSASSTPSSSSSR